MTIGGTTEAAVSVAGVEHEVAVPQAREAAPPERAPSRAPEQAGPPTFAGPDIPARCRCGHPAAAHEHFRPGSDCGACGATQCARYRPTAERRGLVQKIRRAVRRAR